MKRLREPTKPYAPMKPTLPAKEIEDWETLSSIEMDNSDSFSYEDFLGKFIIQADDIKAIRIFVDCEVEHGYYDDVTAKAKIRICKKKMISNPNYEWRESRLAADLKHYNKEKVKYDSDMVKYNIALKAYNAALPAMQEEDRKKSIAFHQKQLKKLQEKK